MSASRSLDERGADITLNNHSRDPHGRVINCQTNRLGKEGGRDPFDLVAVQGARLYRYRFMSSRQLASDTSTPNFFAAEMMRRQARSRCASLTPST